MIPVPVLVVGGATQVIELLGMWTILYGFIVPSRT